MQSRETGATANKHENTEYVDNETKTTFQRQKQKQCKL